MHHTKNIALSDFHAHIIIFLVIALIAAALGFGGLAGTAAGAAKIVFVVGIILFLVSLFMGRKRP